nr:hypothetical protein [Tanacetum cinerariifolium]
MVGKLGTVEERAECKKLKKELEEAKFSNTLLSMQKERVERDLYWTRVHAHEFYRELIRRGVVIMPPKSVPLTQAAIQRMIKESVDAAITAERPRQANAKNNTIGSGSKWNARAMTTAPTEEKVSSGSHPVYERCFTRHVRQCRVKCHKCGKVGHKARSSKRKLEKFVAELVRLRILSRKVRMWLQEVFSLLFENRRRSEPGHLTL